VNRLHEIIELETRNNGVISFARFMELALYCPVYGYYEKEGDTAGRRGDYITSVSVGSLFGELLACQFAAWLEAALHGKCEWKRQEKRVPDRGRGAWGEKGEVPGEKPKTWIVEAGAHDGRLANDILAWLRERRPGLFREMEYWIVEPSAQRQKWQEKTLAPFGDRVRWVTQLSDLTNPLPSSGVCGIIFSNELLDAMPVHRVGWDARKLEWFEWGVGVQDGKCVWTRMTNSEFRIQNSGWPAALLDVLPDGFTTEICPAATNWWREAAHVLQRGKLLTIDYGVSLEEYFAPERMEGTVRSYHRHHLSKDVLSNPGEQDITAHVNFAGIQSAGEAAGLKTEQLVTQESFLTQVAGRMWKDPKDAGNWTDARRRQFQTLTHPEHLGRRFRVLVQSRGQATAELRLRPFVLSR
jgi:SAM-dependent MidA family methyltransferase